MVDEVEHAAEDARADSLFDRLNDTRRVDSGSGVAQIVVVCRFFGLLL